MYQAPIGRPVSSPPSFETTTSPYCASRGKRYTPEEKEAIRADYRAGMTYEEIKAKHGLLHNKSLARLVHDIKDRRKLVIAKPTRMSGESKQQYGARVMQWMWQHDPEWRAEQLRKRKLAHRRKRRAAMKQEAAVAAAKAADAKAQQAVDFDNAHVDEQPMPPPQSIWQRWFGWVRW